MELHEQKYVQMTTTGKMTALHIAAESVALQEPLLEANDMEHVDHVMGTGMEDRTETYGYGRHRYGIIVLDTYPHTEYGVPNVNILSLSSYCSFCLTQSSLAHFVVCCLCASSNTHCSCLLHRIRSRLIYKPYALTRARRYLPSC